jgi:hypothetical protein
VWLLTLQSALQTLGTTFPNTSGEGWWGQWNREPNQAREPSLAGEMSSYSPGEGQIQAVSKDLKASRAGEGFPEVWPEAEM